MIKRLNYFTVAPAAIEILLQQEQYLRQVFTQSEFINIQLWELIKLRVSQLNQCAFCIEMHSHDLLEQGVHPQRLLALNAWRDTPIYSDTEMFVFEFVEKLLTGTAIDDELYQRALATLSEQDLVNLTIAVNAINSWNRIAKLFKPEIGSLR
ncbi:carboxymuconolactone decarboxylase family protein [Alteromonadaceae bacterium BrNp21-10]|nr:carboxymuconolactone decarboxylase family protein [Alteromonadaceae bacterium BrNp21-10]